MKNFKILKNVEIGEIAFYWEIEKGQHFIYKTCFFYRHEFHKWGLI